MRASNWILSGFSLVLCAAGALSAAGSSRKAAIPERIAVQQARLAEIENAAKLERAKIEQRYEQRRAEVTQSLSLKEAARLSYPYRIRWVEFAKMHKGLAYAEGYFETPSYVVPAGRSDRPARLRRAMDQEYFITEMARLLASEEFQDKLTQIVNERWDAPLLPLLREEAQKLLVLVTRVRRELTMELRQLEDQRTASLEATMEWERNLQEQVRGILDYLRESEPKETQRGVVESIGYSPQSGYFCMIEGIDQVLGADDRVGDVRILGIDPEKVTFTKDDVTWAQQLGAPAPSHWR